MAKKILTLDIGAANIALAEYESAGKGGELTLVNYGLAPLAAPLETGDAETILGPALMQVVREKGIKPGPVAVSVSGQLVFPKFAAIPAAGGDDKFEQMIRYEIEQNVPFPIDEMVCDRQVLGDAENGDKNVMIVAAKVDQIEAITAAVTAAGFRPDLIDVSPLALVNAVRAARSSGDDCVIVLDIGAKTTSLVIADGDRVYNRSVPIAGNNITREIAQALDCPPEQAEQLKRAKGYVSLGGAVEDEDAEADRIAKVCRAVMQRLQAEISRSVNFYRSQQGGNAPVKLYLTGGTSVLPQIDRFFAEALQIEVEFFNPFTAVKVGAAVNAEALEAEALSIASTVGVALHQAGAARFAINLLPPSILAERAERAKIPVVIGAAVALLAGLACIYLAETHLKEVARVTYESVDGKVAQLKGSEKQLKAAAQAVEAELAASDKFRELLNSREAAVLHMKAVRTALPAGYWIDKWEGDRVTIRCWKDAEEAAIAARDAELKAAAAKAAKAAAEAASADAAKAEAKPAEGAAAAKPAAKRQGKGAGGVQQSSTVPELVASRLKANPAVVPESVKIVDMTSMGKDQALKQFTVELKFK